MAVKVVIASGKYNIVLPDGNRYQAGDTAVLTDDEYASITSAVKDTLFSSVDTATPTDVDSEANSPNAVVDAAGHTALGDPDAQSESQRPGEDTTYG